jgi:hypothetical protein
VYPGEAPLVVWLGIPGIAAALVALFVWANRRAAARLGLDPRRRTLAAAALAGGWCALQAALAGSGLLARFDARPPPLALFLVAVFAGALALGASRFAAPLVQAFGPGQVNAWVAHLPFVFLPLEWVMHEAARAGVMPSLLSFSGWNFDVVTGTLALPVAALVAIGRAPRWLVPAWNAFGLAALAMIAAIAVGTAPFVQAFGPGQVNAWVAHLPFVFLPGVMVVAALFGHVLVIRQLRPFAPSVGRNRPPGSARPGDPLS